MTPDRTHEPSAAAHGTAREPLHMTTTPNPADLGELVERLREFTYSADVDGQVEEWHPAICLEAADALAAQQREIETWKIRTKAAIDECVKITRRAEALEKERDALKAATAKRAPVQGWAEGIPWDMHLRAYEGYCKRWGSQPALIDLEGRNCRGGFGVKELDMFIPGWREELSESAALKARADNAEAEVAALQAKLDRAAEALGPFLRPVKDIMPHWPDDDYATLEALVLDPLTIGDFRRAAAIHAELTQEGGNV